MNPRAKGMGAHRKTKKASTRARQERSRATIDAIVEGAERALVTHGMEHTTIQKIAETAGVSVGSLYHHFSNKEEILVELFEREFTRPIVDLDAFIEEAVGLPFPDAVLHIIRQLVISSSLKVELRRIIEQEAAKMGMAGRRLEVENQIRQLTRRLLARHERELRFDDLDLAAFLITYAARYTLRTAAEYLHEFIPNDRLALGLTTLITRFGMGDNTPPEWGGPNIVRSTRDDV